MVEFKFHCKMPIFVARQWIRHRTASVNEYSLRYSKAINEFYIPNASELKLQTQKNKQGRAEDTLSAESQKQVLQILMDGVGQAWDTYETLTETGLARELSRINLPLSLFTEWYWKINLHNLLHFLKLRLDEHAQYEIRVYAQAIAGIVKQIVPVSWEAFEDYLLNSKYFSKSELNVLGKALNQVKANLNWEALLKNVDLSKREKQEFLEKINLIMKRRC
jgi:thymidylate synthase (FAD)